MILQIERRRNVPVTPTRVHVGTQHQRPARLRANQHALWCSVGGPPSLAAGHGPFSSPHLCALSGVEWVPQSFMRRLAERPANVGFVVRSVLYERLGKQSPFAD